MPQQFGSSQKPHTDSLDRFVVALMDWVRRVMQLTAPASVLILAFLLYHFVFGIVPDWDVKKQVVAGDAQTIIGGAIAALNVVFAVFLVTLCVLNWSESMLGLTLAIAGLALYFGIPYLFDFLVIPGQLARWQNDGNPAVAIYGELRMLGLISIVPGVVLTIKDIVERCAEGSRENTDKQRAMQFGGAIEQEEPAGEPLIGVSAKCWQLPYCRTAIRGACPIFIARTRCWRHHVGCMCEENVIRQIFDPFVRKMDIAKAPKNETPGINFAVDAPDDEVAPWTRGDAERKAAEEEAARWKPKAARGRIPFNSTLTAGQKRERCRNCIIYTEHQRRKYHFLAPLAVFLSPVLTFAYFEQITTWLTSVAQRVDQATARLLLNPSVPDGGMISSMPTFAQYVLIGCVVVLCITATLRILEYCVFKLQI
jgi:hypothetical protein